MSSTNVPEVRSEEDQLVAIVGGLRAATEETVASLTA